LKRRELIGHLQREGCRLDREGGRHTIYTNPANGAKAPVPRHAEIDNRLARKICQQLAIALAADWSGISILNKKDRRIIRRKLAISVKFQFH